MLYSHKELCISESLAWTWNVSRLEDHKTSEVDQRDQICVQTEFKRTVFSTTYTSLTMKQRKFNCDIKKFSCNDLCACAVHSIESQPPSNSRKKKDQYDINLNDIWMINAFYFPLNRIFFLYFPTFLYAIQILIYKEMNNQHTFQNTIIFPIICLSYALSYLVLFPIYR